MVSASIAFDQIMSFKGSFADHILAEKAHVLSISFLIDSLKKHRGGVGGNIAWSLGLLGEPSALVGSVGEDFAEYRATLEEVGVETGGVVVVPEEYTASGFMSADMHGNQIASFYPGAMSASRDIDISDAANAAEYVIVGAHDPEGMMRHVREVAASRARLLFDPSQQIPILTGEQLAEGIDLADIVVANDYEYSMIGKKAGLALDDIERRVDMLVITYGENGSEVRAGGDRVHIPVAPLTAWSIRPARRCLPRRLDQGPADGSRARRRRADRGAGGDLPDRALRNPGAAVYPSGVHRPLRGVVPRLRGPAQPGGLHRHRSGEGARTVDRRDFHAIATPDVAPPAVA